MNKKLTITPVSVNTTDKRDTMIMDTVPVKPINKPAVFNAVKVTSSTYIEGKLIPSFVLKLNMRNKAPSVGDSVRLKSGVKTFNGTIHSINSLGVITLKLT